MKFNKNIGMLLLGIYLVLIGVIAIFRIGTIGEVLPYLALVAGIFILIGK